MTTSFPKFGLLPLEIRQRIWELSMERRRVPVGDFPVISDEWGAESGPRPPAVPPPAVLQACVESRSYLDRYYVKAFTTVSPPRYTWIDFDMDTVCLRQRTVEKFPKDVLPIRYLSIDGISTEEYEGWIAYIDSCVPLLADLEIRPIHEPVEWWVRWEALMTLWYYNDHPKPFRTTIIGPADCQFVPELTQDNFAKVRRDHLRRQYAENPENFLPGTEMWDSDDDECHPDWRHVPGCECPPEERWAPRMALLLWSGGWSRSVSTGDTGVPLDQRRFGVKCARAPLYENGPCPDPAPPAPKYTHCRINEWINDPDDPAGVQRIQRTRDCESLPEFMAHLDNVAHYRNRGFVADHGRPQTDLDFDVVNAAERIEALRNDRLRPPPWRMYKEGSDPGHYAEDDNGRRVATYNGFLESTFNYMVRLKANMTPEQHNAIRGWFGHFEAARFQLSRARQADADHHWMNEIQRRNPGIVPVYEDLGYRDGVYTNHPRPARLYDHERTIANHVGRMPDIAEQLQRYRVDFMRNDLGRRNHAAVMGRIENGAQLLGHTDAGCLLP